MPRFGPLLGTLALLALPLGARADDPPKPLKALLITGGCCHDYTNQKTILSDGIAERARIEFTVVQQGGNGTFAKLPIYEKDDWARGYDVVIHDECFADTKDPEWTKRILKPHEDGVPGVVIHCAMHCYRDGTDNWFKFCGVTSRRHGAAYPHEVLNVDAAHPIMKGFGPAWANPAGELYWIEKVWPTAHPLCVSKNEENGHEETCVWTNQYGKGRVFGTTIGHHNETVSSPEFLNLLTRGTLWACDKLSDDYLKPSKAKEARVDLAKKRPTLASSEEAGKGNLAPLAVDGNPETRWCANNSDEGQWWQVDLGRPEVLTGLRLDWENPGAAYRCKVEGSEDGKSWTTLADASKNDKTGPKQVDFAEKSRPSRFVRVTYLGCNTGSWASLREVKVLGEKTEVVNADDPRKEADAPIFADVKLPEGYEATVFARPPAVNYPVAVAAATNGDIYVSVDKNGSLGRGPHRGSVYRLRDLDGDGRADETTLFVADVDSPRGLVWDGDRLYLMHPPHLSAFIDRDGDGHAEEEQVLVKDIAFTFKDRPADHTSNGVTLGIDGWLYLAIGDFGFMNAEGADGRKLQFRGGGVVRVRPDGSNLEVFSRGTRNILEVAMDPRLNGFTRDNTNDGGGWDIRLHHFSGMEHHGYPSLFQNFKDEIIQPLADYGGGSGCGALFLSEPGFPNGDGDALYTADWGRGWVFRHHAKHNGATFSADQSEFLAVPRVTDLDVDGSSHLFVTSWKGAVFDYAGEEVGYVLRVSPKGYRPAPLPEFATMDDGRLVDSLNSPSHRRRLEAQRTLLRRGLAGPKTVEALAELAGDRRKNKDGRIAAIFAIKQGMGSKATETLLPLASDAIVGDAALRALADRGDEDANVPAKPFLDALSSPMPSTRLQAVIGLARLGKVENAPAMTALLDDPDPVVAHTTIRSLANLKAIDALFSTVDRTDAPLPRRLSALKSLQLIHDPRVVDELASRLDSPAIRKGMISALARLAFIEGTWKGDSWGTRPDTSGPYYQPESWAGTAKATAALRDALMTMKGGDAAFLLKELDRHKVKLDGGLDAVVAMAAKEASLIPSAVNQLAKAEAIPSAALPILVRAATDPATPADVRASALVGLARVADPSAVSASLDALSRFNPDSPELGRARSAFLGSSKMAENHGILEEAAAKLDGSPSDWADAALLVISNDGNASPETKSAAAKAISEGWAVPKRRIQILRAATLANHRPFADRILAAMADPDPSVASAAKEAASKMKLGERRGRGGPVVGSMTPDDALKAVVSAKGDRSLGEMLFTQQNCTNCHTIRQSDPPRGPYLGTIATTYKRRELAEAILAPSKTIAQGFVTNVFALDDGKVISGFVVKEAADGVTIRTADAKEFTIPSAKIEERTKTQVSVMPEGLVAPLTVREFASLLDYLEGLSAGKP